MITLGARGCPSREGVPGPAVPALAVAPGLMTPCWPSCAPAAREPEAGCAFGCDEPVCPAGASTAGWILLRASVSWVCDEDGVAWAEPEGELEAASEGDAVPEVESFFLDDLLSLLRESCSETLCLKPFMAARRRARARQALRRWCGGGAVRIGGWPSRRQQWYRDPTAPMQHGGSRTLSISQGRGRWMLRPASRNKASCA